MIQFRLQSTVKQASDILQLNQRRIVKILMLQECSAVVRRTKIVAPRNIQGGSNMTGTDLCVNKPHCAAAVRPSESEATTSTLPPARVRTCSVLSGSCQSDERTKVPRSVEQRIVIKFLAGENVPSAEILHRLQQQYG